MPSRPPSIAARIACAALVAGAVIASMPRDTTAADLLDPLTSPTPLPSVVPLALPSPIPLPKVTPLPTVKLTPLPTVRLTPLPTVRLTPLPTVKLTPLPTLPLPTPSVPLPTPTLPLPTPTLPVPGASATPSPAGAAAAATANPSPSAPLSGPNAGVAGGSTFTPAGGTSGIVGPLAPSASVGPGPADIGLALLAIVVPALLLAAILVGQGAVAAAWIPLIRRRLGGLPTVHDATESDRPRG